jgi:hypothetical protein
MSEEKAPYHTGGNWQLPDYSSRDFLLEISLQGHDMPMASASTIGGLLATIRSLADGQYRVSAIFNGQVLGRGDYRKEGREIEVFTESGAIVGVFAPLCWEDVTGPRCAKCGKVIVGEPSASPSWDGPLCGSCAWEEWLIDA